MSTELSQDYKKSMYRLRKAIGILGLALPVLLLYNHEELLSSMSHYYYSSSSIFFIGILSAFGLTLYSYKGYPPEPGKKEFLSDDLATTLAAIFIFITVLVPTASENSMGKIYFHGSPIDDYLFGHVSNSIKNTIHLASAGLFLIILGYMSYFKFTMSDKMTKSRKRFFRICGRFIWGSIVVLIAIIIGEKILDEDFNKILPAYVLWFEWIAVWSFALAWLIKGKIDQDLMEMVRRKDK